MSFDPDKLVSLHDHDEYVRWSARELVAAVEREETGRQVYATAMRAASWLWVVAQAQMHLDDAIVEGREVHQATLAKLFARACQVERARGDVRFSDLLASRIALDCFEPVGKHGSTLLEAARLAVDALELIFVYPPADKWDLRCPGSWALVMCGAVLLETVTEPLMWADYSVRPSPGMVGKITWDAANRVAQASGARFPSPN